MTAQETQNVCFTDLLKSYQTVYETMSMAVQETNMSLLHAFSGGGGGFMGPDRVGPVSYGLGSTGMNYCKPPCSLERNHQDDGEHTKTTDKINKSNRPTMWPIQTSCLSHANPTYSNHLA